MLCSVDRKPRGQFFENSLTQLGLIHERKGNVILGSLFYLVGLQRPNFSLAIPKDHSAIPRFNDDLSLHREDGSILIDRYGLDGRGRCDGPDAVEDKAREAAPP